MDYTHTEAHQMAYDFSVYLHEKMKKFPHYEKFTLQKDIRESIDGILDEIEMFEITKVASHLYAADRLKRRLTIRRESIEFSKCGSQKKELLWRFRSSIV